MNKVAKTLILLSVIFAGPKVYSQARTSVAIGYMFNKPFSSDYSVDGGISFVGNIAIAKKWIIAPEVAYDKLDGNNERFFNSDGFATRSIQNIDLFHLGVCARYQFNPTLFVKAGPILFAGGGNEDIAGAGIGGTSAVGYNLNLDQHNTLEFSVNLTVVSIDDAAGNGVTPFAGLRIAYAFNFGGAVKKPY